MKIKLCKLVSGEEVMGEDVSDSLDKVRLQNPVRIATVRGQDGNPNVGFAPFPTFADEVPGQVVEFDRHHVLYSYVPATDFCKNYEQIFGLGLILPTEKQIITG